MTLAQLAAGTMSASALGAVEREQRSISLDAVEAIAKRLELPLRSLLVDTPGADQAAKLMLDRGLSSLVSEQPHECLEQLDDDIMPESLRPMALFCRGVALFWTGQVEAALPVFHEALALGPQANDPTLVGRIEGNIGQVLYELHQFDEALTWYRQAFDHLYAADAPRLYAKVIVDIGHIHLIQGDVDLALRYYDRGRTYTDSLDDFHALGASYSGMSEAYHMKGDDAMAVYYARLSMSAIESSGDARTTANAYALLAARLLDLGDLDEAESIAREAISRSEATESADFEASARSTLAKILWRRGWALAAEREATLAASLVPDRPTLGRLEAWLVLAEIVELRGDVAQADALHGQALEGFLESGLIARYAEASVEYSERLRRRGELDRAAEVALRAADVRRGVPVQ